MGSAEPSPSTAIRVQRRSNGMFVRIGRIPKKKREKKRISRGTQKRVMKAEGARKGNLWDGSKKYEERGWNREGADKPERKQRTGGGGF